MFVEQMINDLGVKNKNNLWKIVEKTVFFDVLGENLKTILVEILAFLNCI